MSRTLWPHQERGIKDVMDALFATTLRRGLTIGMGFGARAVPVEPGDVKLIVGA